MSADKSRAWYSYPWLWFVIALPMSAVVAALTSVYLAFAHQDVVVQDDWDEDSQAVNLAITHEHNAAAMGLVASLSVDNVSGDVTVGLRGHLTQSPAAVQLKISHPTDAARDQKLTLVRRADGSYHGSLVRPLNGRYYLALEAADWRLTDQATFPQGSFDIQAAHPGHP